VHRRSTIGASGLEGRWRAGPWGVAATPRDICRLQLGSNCQLGLPTFVRIGPDCVDICDTLAGAVDAQAGEPPKLNQLRPCGRRCIEPPPCQPLDILALQPRTSVRWGDSPCDRIEGDDTEVIHLTVCNLYSNVTMSI
jgi:hypothetical protein